MLEVAPNDASRLILQRELVRRCERNPQYSLRSFARAIGVSHSLLSLILSGKRRLSKKAAAKVLDCLELTPEERNLLATSPRSRKSEEMVDPVTRMPAPESFQDISLDSFTVISDWYHYAILSLMEIPRSKFEPAWIANRLGITEMQAKSAMERLKRLGMISRVGKCWKQTGLPLKVDNTVSTAATRKFHRQLLEKAVTSLENEPFERREFYSMTLAIDSSLVEYARKQIKAFGRQLMRDLEKRKPAGEVYNLSVQLFPLSHVKEDK